MLIPLIGTITGLILITHGTLSLVHKPYFDWWNSKFWDPESTYKTDESVYFYNYYGRNIAAIFGGCLFLGIVFYFEIYLNYL